MTLSNNKLIAVVAVTSISSAFGTVVLMPALREWHEGTTVLWWLCYVALTSMSVASGQGMRSWQRAIISVIPAVLPLLYITLSVKILGRHFRMSDIPSNSELFPNLIAAFFIFTWLLVFIFSYARSFFESIIKTLIQDGTEGRIQRASKVLAALVGLVGATGLFIKAILLSN